MFNARKYNGADLERDYYRRSQRGDGNGREGPRSHDVGLRDESRINLSEILRRF